MASQFSNKAKPRGTRGPLPPASCAAAPCAERLSQGFGPRGATLGPGHQDLAPNRKHTRNFLGPQTVAWRRAASETLGHGIAFCHQSTHPSHRATAQALRTRPRAQAAYKPPEHSGRRSVPATSQQYHRRSRTWRTKPRRPSPFRFNAKKRRMERPDHELLIQATCASLPAAILPSHL